MAIHHAVLALLAHGPGHGYQLKEDFEAAVGPQWGGLNIGHLYQVLDRLSRDGLVTSTRVTQDTRPDRVVYQITKEGSAELDRWLTEPAPRTAGYRDDFFLKVMAAVHAGSPGVVRQVLTVQRSHLLRELRNLVTLQDTHGSDLVVGLLLAAATRHVTADLSFLEDIEHALLADGGAALRELRSGRVPVADRSAAGAAPRRSTRSKGAA